MNSQTLFSLREAALILTRDHKEVVRLVDEHAELSVTVEHGGRSLRALSRADLVYALALAACGDLLTPKGRLELHKALLDAKKGAENSSEPRPTVRLRNVEVKTEELEKDLDNRLVALKTLRASVEGDLDDPKIKGTEIEAYRISALLDGGATVSEVLEDYPGLDATQVEVARAYAQAIPKQGRPYPSRSFKRAVQGLDLDALDDALDELRGVDNSWTVHYQRSQCCFGVFFARPRKKREYQGEGS